MSLSIETNDIETTAAGEWTSDGDLVAAEIGGVSRRALLGRGAGVALTLLAGGFGGLQAQEITFADDANLAQQPGGGGQKPKPSTPAAKPKPPAENPKPAATTEAKPAAAVKPITVAVVGLGDQGRAHLSALQYVPGAVVKYVCDSYPNIHKRALEIAPKAQAITDYKVALDDKEVQAIYVATPSHQHKQIVMDALAAGKHVYCEAPLASNMNEAKEIAQAGKAAKTIFCSGLQGRSNQQNYHVLKFIRTGALGPKIAQSRAQFHQKTSWRREAASDARQNALNWRLKRETSGGLLGEIGIHQMDTAAWYFKARPVAVSGFGGILVYQDGRDVPDTVQCVLEFPNDVRMTYDATLANSFDGQYELFQGTDAAILMRGQRAWMFKEADAPALGWEVYAYTEQFGDEKGIALVADASKLLADGKKPGDYRGGDPKRSALYYASDAFLTAIREGKESPCPAQMGYEATIVALTANEAVLKSGKITLSEAMFAL